MAQLNVFKSTLKKVTTVETDMYQAPVGYTTVLLNAQASNVTASAGTVTLKIVDTSGAITNALVYDLPLPGNDATNCITGKVVLETGDKLRAYANANNTIELTLSYLESLNA